MSERRIKRGALRDVASMIRSFNYVSCAVLFGQVPGIVVGAEAKPRLERWARAWRTWVSAAFLREYLESAKAGEFVPKSQRELRILLRSYLIEKCLFEISFELEYRRDWLKIPLTGILELAKGTEEAVREKEKVS